MPMRWKPSGSAVVVGLILVLALSLRLYHFTYPFLDHHSWRQTQTAMVARNYLRGGFNILRPEVDWFGKGPSVVELEFGLTPYMTSFLYVLFGVHDWVGRVVPIAFSLASIVYLYLLVRYLSDEDTAIFSCFAYAILPLNVFFSRVQMPESAMLLFTIGSLYHFSKYVKYGGYRQYVLSLAFTSLAYLTKLPSLYLILPLAYIAWAGRQTGSAGYRHVSLFFILTVGVAISYYWYIHQVADVGTIGYVFGQDKWGGGSVWFDGTFYSTIWSRLTDVVYTEVGLALLAFGMVVARKHVLFHVWLLSVVLYILTVAKGNEVHDYYQMPLLPVGSFYIGSALSLSYKSRGLKPFTIGLCALFLGSSVVHLMPLYGLYGLPAYHAGMKAGEIDASNSLILTVVDRPDLMPEILYYADRKGWAVWPQNVSVETIESYRQMGARYLVMSGLSSPPDMVEAYLRGKQSFSGPDYLIVLL